MKALTITRQIGGSLVATIPKEIVNEEGLLPNQPIEIQVRKVKRSFFGSAKGIGPFTTEDEMKAHDY